MITLNDLKFHGEDLNRPECVLSHKSGLLFAPCWHGDGGVSVISASGKTTHILASDVSEPIRPNGIALEKGGSFLLAHLGDERGAIIRLFHDGRTELVIDEIDGQPIPPANFVTVDRAGRIWITVSTKVIPRADDYRRSASTGFIALCENGTTRIVADGLGYANEIAFSDDEKTLWVNETFARRTTRFAVSDNCALAEQQSIATYQAGTFPDGLAPDNEGGLWVTSIISNRVLRITETKTATVLEDSDADHLAWVEAAYIGDSLGRQHIDKAVSKRLRNISNLAFGGDDMKTAFLGCLLGDKIASFRTEVAGAPLPHWDVDLGPLSRFLDKP